MGKLEVKKFALEKGDFRVVVCYEDDEGIKTDKSYQRPRPKLYDQWATLGLYAREYYNLPDVKLRVAEISFTTNHNEGRFVKLTLETVDEPNYFKVSPEKIERILEVQAVTTDRLEGSKKNELLDQIDLVENKITEYLNGDREQLEHPEVKEAEKANKKRKGFGLSLFGKGTAEAVVVEGR